MPFQYVAFYKPYGVLSQFTGEAGQRTLSEFGLAKGVYAAGRLDKDSEGLLLLTDDGPFKARLLDPKNNHPRCYWAQVEGSIDQSALQELSTGVKIKGHQTKACLVNLIDPPMDLALRDPPIRVRKNIPTSWISLTLTEGKNRQVRRMTAKVGFPTLRLIRYKIETLSLNNMRPGQWKIVNKEDITGF